MSIWNSIRKINAEILNDYLSIFNNVRLIKMLPNFIHAWYKFYCFIDFKQLKTGFTKDLIICEINELGYSAFEGGCSESYLDKYFQKLNLTPNKRLKNAKLLGESSLMFLINPTISENEMIDYYAEFIQNLIKRAF